MALPKVLIIGQPFNNDTGGGITLTSLFNGWDREKLAVACSGYLLLDNIDTNVCNTYFQLGYKEHKWRFPFNILQRKYTSGLLKFDEKRIQNMTIEKSGLRIRFIMEVFYPFLEFIGLYQYMFRTKLSDDFCTWLDEFKPDVIYDQPSTRDGILFCLDVHSYLRKPLILHMMDDWPSTISDKGIFKRYWHRKIDQEFRRLLDRTSILMSISHEMGREYKTRYGKDFITFHNAIDLDFWNRNQRRSYELDKNPAILYAGRIGLGIESSLELFVKAIEQINEENNMSVKFMLQTQDEPDWTADYKSVTHNKFVSYSDLPRVFSEADFLLLPYDFTSESIKYIKYSMPTKAPEYMVSGTTIIIFAPEETAIVKYAKRDEWAKVITENRIGAIADSVKQLITDKGLRQHIAQNAIEIANKNHNANDVRKKFREIIVSVVGASSSLHPGGRHV